MGWTAAAVVVALALGLVNLWFGVVVPHRSNRHADVALRLESYFRPSQWGRDTARPDEEEDFRFVLQNYGPSTARDVTFVLTEGLPSAAELVGVNEGGLLSTALPVDLLHAGEEFHIRYFMTMGSALPTKAAVTWRDSAGNKQRDIVLSVQTVT